MKFARILAATAAAIALALAPAVAIAKPATPVRPAPAVAAVAVHAVKASTTSLTGCTTTVTPSTVFGGWTWRTTYEVCPSLGDTQQAQSCVTVDRYNPAAVPTTVPVLPRTCLYGRAR